MLRGLVRLFQRRGKQQPDHAQTKAERNGGNPDLLSRRRGPGGMTW